MDLGVTNGPPPSTTTNALTRGRCGILHIGNQMHQPKRRDPKAKMKHVPKALSAMYRSCHMGSEGNGAHGALGRPRQVERHVVSGGVAVHCNIVRNINDNEIFATESPYQQIGILIRYGRRQDARA
jgi:hypothetical protein